MGHLNGKMYSFEKGTREELIRVWHYLREEYPGMLSGEVYGRAKIFGVIEDKTVPPGTWLFSLRELNNETE